MHTVSNNFVSMPSEHYIQHAYRYAYNMHILYLYKWTLQKSTISLNFVYRKNRQRLMESNPNYSSECEL